MTKPVLRHLPLEPYKARYTEYLGQLESSAFSSRFTLDTIVPDEKVDVVTQISNGEVLDSFRRPIWAMAQISRLLTVGREIGKIWCSDFYTPGLDALAYSRANFRAYSFLWAQTFDIYDFTTRFHDWMRPWEIMAFNVYSKVFVASPLLKELIVASLGPAIEPKIQVVGLPFNRALVSSQLGQLPARTFDVVYSSRWDTEKQPSFFLDLAESRQDLRFLVCFGQSELRGTDSAAVLRAKRLMERSSNVTFALGLDKPDYFRMLASSKVQFNCAEQDWVSFTLLEALSAGCKPLYPNWRDFPQTLMYRDRNLYIPGLLESASEKLDILLQYPDEEEDQSFANAILDYHGATLERIAHEISKPS